MKRTLIAVALASVVPLAGLLAQPSIIRFSPPTPDNYGVEKFWNLTLNNPDRDTYSVWLEGKITEKQKGQVFWAQTNPFPLPPGPMFIRYADIKRIGIAHQDYASGYGEFVARTGGLPPGTYTFEIRLEPNFDTMVAPQFDVRPMGPPRLILPRDGDTIKLKYPQFVWTPPLPKPAGLVTYDFKLCEVLPGQTPQEAMAANLPWFEERGIRTTNLAYPVSARPLRDTGTFAWQVVATGQGGVTSKSDVRAFARAPDAGPAPAGESMRVIVRLNAPASDSIMRYIRTVIGPFKPKYVYHIIQGFSATLSREQIAALEKDSVVEEVNPVQKVESFMSTAQAGFGTAKARQDFGVDGDCDGNPTSYSKADIVIAILDSGTDPNHMDLDGGKIIGWKDFVNNQTTPYDDECYVYNGQIIQGHGTHCASIAAGSGDANAAYKGVAPGAAIVSVKVMGSSGWGTTDDIVAGMEWVVDNKATYGIEVMSLSIGGLVGTSDGTDDMSDAANSAVAAGIVVCAAAANSGPERQTTASPAAAKDVIAVGAMSDPGEGGFFQAYFSSRGPTADQRIKPDVCGPGWNIMAALRNTTSGYQAKYGTSMACPFVAGVCALMLDANPSLTPAQLKSKLTATCQGWGPSGKDVDYGFGRVRAWNAVRAAGGFTTGTSPSAPAHICKVGSLAATGSYDDWTFNVTSTTYPLAATLIMTNGSGSSPNFGLTLYNPAGTAVKTTTTQTRQDYFTYQPAVTGTYKLRIKSTTGAGPYSCDVSGAVVDLTPVPPVKDITAPAAGEQNE